MAALNEKPLKVMGWHIHVYHDAEDRAKIEGMRSVFAKNYRCALSPVRDRAGGPHPKPNLGIQVRPEDFGDIIGWLTINRGGLSVLAHVQTEDSFDDHTQNAFWMGEPLALDAAYLELIKAGRRNPWTGVEFFNGAEPEWEPAN